MLGLMQIFLRPFALTPKSAATFVIGRSQISAYNLDRVSVVSFI